MNPHNPYASEGVLADELMREALAELLKANNVTAKDVEERLGGRQTVIPPKDKPLFVHRIGEIAAALGYSWEFRFTPLEVYGPTHATCPRCGEPDVRITTKGRLSHHGANKQCPGTGTQIWSKPRDEWVS